MPPTPKEVTEEIWSRMAGRMLASDNGCIVWAASAGKRSYGQIMVHGKNYRTHRVAYEKFRGPIENGKHIDHLCRNRACCNPNHLEVVTNAENVLRGNGPTARNARKTHCNKGHEFTDENTYYSRGRKNNRTCRKCKRRQQSERWHRNHPKTLQALRSMRINPLTER